MWVDFRQQHCFARASITGRSFFAAYTYQHSRFVAATRPVQLASCYSRKQICRNRPHVTPRTFFAREMYIIYAGGKRGSERPLTGLAA